MNRRVRDEYKLLRFELTCSLVVLQSRVMVARVKHAVTDRQNCSTRFYISHCTMGHVIAQGLLCLFVCLSDVESSHFHSYMLNGLDAQQAEA